MSVPVPPCTSFNVCVRLVIDSEYSGDDGAGMGHPAVYRRAEGAVGIQREPLHLHGDLQRVGPLYISQRIHVSSSGGSNITTKVSYTKLLWRNLILVNLHPNNFFLLLYSKGSFSNHQLILIWCTSSCSLIRSWRRPSSSSWYLLARYIVPSHFSCSPTWKPNFLVWYTYLFFLTS